MRITPDDFRDRSRANPRWMEELTEECVVDGPIEMRGEPIVCTSPLLVVDGVNREGFAATFDHCNALKTIAGVFHGGLSVRSSSVVECFATVTASCIYGAALWANNCLELRQIAGRYAGSVSASGSRISDVSEIAITQRGDQGNALFVENCALLHEIRGNFPGGVVASLSAVRDISRLYVAEANDCGTAVGLFGCRQLEEVPARLLRMGVAADEELIEKWTQRAREHAKEVIGKMRPQTFTMPDILPQNTTRPAICQEVR